VTAGAGSLGTIQPGHHFDWMVANFFEALTRWAVPVFVMISGALLLPDDRIISFRAFMKKRVSKVFIPFVGWSILFYLYGAYVGSFPFSLKTWVKLFITNGISYHLWFLYMIVGIYLITPLLQVFVKHASRQHIQYFLFLWFYASVLTRLSDFFIKVHLSIELFYVTDYVGYFLLGYYLSKYEIPKNLRIWSYYGMIVGSIGTFLGTYYYSVRGNGHLNEFWYSYFSPNVLLCSVGLFIWFRYHFKESNLKLPFLFRGINQASLGVYILHYWLMNNFLWKVYPHVLTHFHPIIALPIDIVLTLVLSVLLTLVLKMIPIVNKLVP
jgi:surface polysaccharide O-acyltransferase-like enzyme